MDVGTQRISHQQLNITPQPVNAKEEKTSVKTELTEGLAVNLAQESDSSETSSDKGHQSDSRIGFPATDLPKLTELTEERVIKEHVHDEELGSSVYRLRKEPEGAVIFEVPSEAVRKMRLFVDQLLSVQETGLSHHKAVGEAIEATKQHEEAS
ncbi:hypothetical protein [Flexibacterium corallicola]|uniref:hypothetical protein n=1 Tax=Flexibacterium corallicola TaxID=3037259 RepID=UPI00286F0EF1|nr:hypothetical protein [Pseudovibrio sp. M1P-2-3]